MSNSSADVFVTANIAGPLDLDILLPQTDGSCLSRGLGDHSLPTTVTLTLFYDQAVLDALGVDEDDLAIMQYEPPQGQGAGSWTKLDTIDQDTDLNWISAAILRDGIFAIVAWQPTPPP
jgi:hypothetical protein